MWAQVKTTLACASIVVDLMGSALAQHDTKFRERVDICVRVAQQASLSNVDPALAIAVSWRESRLTEKHTPNSANCVGPMQIKYRYWCPNARGEWSAQHADGTLDSCDTVERGVFALSYYQKKHGNNLYRALCGYGWGTCDTDTKIKYVRHTLSVYNQIRGKLN
jgi:hypothetical protein